jgi:prepilin peptidase dependent protein B
MSRKNSRGLSLVELMIALAIGLIVVGAVLAFTLSSLTANSEYVQSTRLNQELRNSMDFISRELRRAGYDQNNAAYTAVSSNPSSASVSPFGRILIEADTDNDGAQNDACIIYAYDRPNDDLSDKSGQVDLSNGEIRAVRLAFRDISGVTIGVLEVFESSSSEPDCDVGSPDYTSYPAACSDGWCALSDPLLLNITQFSIGKGDGYVVQTGSSTSTPVVMRELLVELQAELRRSEDGVVTRGIRSSVKVRADCLESQADCESAPAGI